MANNNPGNASIWPTITVVLAIMTVGVAGWDAVLQAKNKALQDDVTKLRKRVDALEGEAKTLQTRVAAVAPPPAPAGSSSRRRRAAAAAAAAATQPTTAPATSPVPPLNPAK
jgi:uncharacterized protein YlxW (UPF0749 family)